MSQENVDLVTRGYDDFNSGDIESLTARFDPNIEWIEPGGGNAPAGTFTGPESVVSDVFGAVQANFDEFSCTVADADDQGDTVVVTASFKGKSKSGADLDLQGKHTWQVSGGKIARFENEIDQDAWAKAWS